MPDNLSREERAMIDEAVAAGRVTRCPDAHGFYEYAETAKQIISRQMRVEAARRGAERANRGR